MLSPLDHLGPARRAAAGLPDHDTLATTLLQAAQRDAIAGLNGTIEKRDAATLALSRARRDFALHHLVRHPDSRPVPLPAFAGIHPGSPLGLALALAATNEDQPPGPGPNALIWLPICGRQASVSDDNDWRGELHAWVALAGWTLLAAGHKPPDPANLVEAARLWSTLAPAHGQEPEPDEDDEGDLDDDEEAAPAADPTT